MSTTENPRPRVIAVVPNKNGLAHLAYSIPSLLATAYAEFDILVVDDRSNDDSLAFLRREFPAVKCIVNSRKPGFAGAVNCGIEHAVAHGYDFIAVTNNDIKVSPGWLDLAIAARPKAAALLGFQEVPLKPDSPPDETLMPEKADYEAVSGLPGCLYLCPANIFQTVGLYDEAYFMYGEDNDFFSRLRRNGIQLLQSNIPVWHFGEGSSQKAMPRITWLAYRNAIRYAIKNESPIGILVMMASLLNQGCNPFLRPRNPSPNYRRLRRYLIPVNFLFWVGSLCWNAACLPLTLYARFFPSHAGERLSSPPLILMLTPYYTPGHRKTGGPVRSLTSLVRQLNGALAFKVITADREPGDRAPYPGIVLNCWHEMAGTHVFYSSQGYAGIRQLMDLFGTTQRNAIYMNSVFSPQFTIFPLLLRRLRMMPPEPIVISPRGELAAEALRHKGLKKSIFLLLARFIGLYSDALWLAASSQEKSDIQALFGKNTKVSIAADLADFDAIEGHDRRPKIPGELTAVFLGRIARIKNLSGALKALATVNAKVCFNIYGMIDEPEYWKECAALIKTLPNNIAAHHLGALEPTRVLPTLAEHDLLILPSLGESFGHAILEALVAGCPVLTSDKTPWNGLEAALAGRAVGLENPALLSSSIQEFADMDDQTHSLWRRGAKVYAQARLTDESDKERTLALFRSACGPPS